nr:transglycosylase domain-containing protein [Campylobacter concisus]
MFRAFFHNLRSDNRIGASTITMQVARIQKRNL